MPDVEAKPGMQVIVNWPGNRVLNGKVGRIQEVVPPNCLKVYFPHAKAYFLVNVSHCMIREKGRTNAAQEDLPF
jgi:hypothetical protein